MNLRAVVILDLTRLHLGHRDDVSTVKGAFWGTLADTPAGADVRLIVPKWDWWCGLVIREFVDLADHLGNVTLECTDPDTVRRWVQAISEHQRASA